MNRSGLLRNLRGVTGPLLLPTVPRHLSTLHSPRALRGSRVSISTHHYRAVTSTASGPDLNATRAAILEAALRHVGSEGLPSVTQGMFHNGALDLVYYFMKKAHIHTLRELEAVSAEQQLQQPSPNECIRAGVMARIRYLAPFRQSWAQVSGVTIAASRPKFTKDYTVDTLRLRYVRPHVLVPFVQAMALGAMPQNIAYTTHLLGIVVDDLWWHAGDRSVDMNWYSRRALLMGILVATETFSLTDTSLNMIETEDFLKRRLSHVSLLSDALDGSLSVANAVGGSIASVVSAGMDAVRAPARGFGDALPFRVAASVLLPLSGSVPLFGPALGHILGYVLASGKQRTTTTGTQYSRAGERSQEHGSYASAATSSTASAAAAESSDQRFTNTSAPPSSFSSTSDGANTFTEMNGRPEVGAAPSEEEGSTSILNGTGGPVEVPVHVHRAATTL